MRMIFRVTHLLLWNRRRLLQDHLWEVQGDYLWLQTEEIKVLAQLVLIVVSLAHQILITTLQTEASLVCILLLRQDVLVGQAVQDRRVSMFAAVGV
eukprot:1442891-Ditylum_brightwellii.AAC.1